ncbi:MAG: DUF4876 domain-containing protein [Prevotellaceae bacterium]|jgi:hypothetical protein|nr:DUF4876 domain-containing protein [Prevotellaceae bacterium]
MKTTFFRNIVEAWRAALFVGGCAFLLALAMTACEQDDDLKPVKTYDVTLQLGYPAGFAPVAGVPVTLKNTITGVVDSKSADADGLVTFTVIAGLYEATASEERSDTLYRYLLNGANSHIEVTDAGTNSAPVPLTLTLQAVPKPAEGDVSPHGKLIIKELYIGGCQKNDGSGAFIMDPYIVIYNNSTQPATINNLAVGGLFPSNAHGSNYFYSNGQLTYANEGWLPAHFGVWQIHQNDTLLPGEQIVVAINGAIDHTVIYSNSVNLANADYYVCYDVEKWNNANYYPAPSELIPTSHYLTAYKFPGATGNAWILSAIDPAAIIFTPGDGVTLSEFANVPENLVYHSANGAANSQVGLKVPTEWVLDGIEVYQAGNANNQKRLTPSVDVGYIEFTNNRGHTLYRNVDRAATEAIIANAGKLVYSYSLGVDGSTDPSGIDAEASIRNGAHIIYKETNNTTNDFHQRSRASLRN